MIAAEELYVDMARIRVQTADTELTPNELVTAGSMSIEHSGSAVRVASATAREVLLSRAADALRVPRSGLTIEDGVITSVETNEQTDYWSLTNGEHFHLEITRLPPLKHAHDYQIIGKRQPRLDIPDKVQGNVAFVHDMELPRMRYGRLIKPPTIDARLEEAPSSIEGLDIQIVRDGSFLGVIADREDIAARAAERLAGLVRWTAAPLAPLPADIPDYLRSHVTRSLPVVNGTPTDDPVPDHPPPDDAATTLSAHLLPALSDARRNGTLRRHRALHERAPDRVFPQPGHRGTQIGAQRRTRSVPRSDPRHPRGRVRDATATTARTTWPSMPRCSRLPWSRIRSRCAGPAPTSTVSSPMARHH